MLIKEHYQLYCDIAVSEHKHNSLLRFFFQPVWLHLGWWWRSRLSILQGSGIFKKSSLKSFLFSSLLTTGSTGTLTEGQNIKLSRFIEFIPKDSSVAVNALAILQGWQKATDHSVCGHECIPAQRLASAPGVQKWPTFSDTFNTQFISAPHKARKKATHSDTADKLLQS